MGSGFTGGVRVVMGDINHDGMPDIVVGAGPGGGPRVQVLDGSTGTALSGSIGSFYAYDTAFSGGVQVAIADVNLDGYDDVITAPGAGGGPNVKIFSGYDASLLASFYAFDSAFTGGVTIATADYNGDGIVDLSAGAGIGGGPNVKIFDLSNLSSIAPIAGPLGSFWAFDSSFTGGVTLGTNPAYPDLTGDGIPDILVAQGPGSGSLVRVIDGSSGAVATEFSPLGTVTTGLRVATGLVNNDAIPDIIIGKVPGVSTNPLVYSGIDFSKQTSLSAGTVTPLGTISGKSGTLLGTSAIGGVTMSTSGALTVGATVDVVVQLSADSSGWAPGGMVNLTVNYPDAAIAYNVTGELTASGTNGIATIPITIAAAGAMNISGIYGGDLNYGNYKLAVMPKTIVDSGIAPIPSNLEKFPIIHYPGQPSYPAPSPSPSPPIPRPVPQPTPDPVGVTSPRINQTVLPILFGNLNPAGYDGYWLFSNNDLPGNGLLGLSRTWSNKPGLASGAVGTGSTIADMPRLQQGGGSLIQLIVNSSKAYEFDQISSTYVPRFRQPFKIYAQTGNELVVATDSGRVFTFFDFSTSVPSSQRGTFKSMMDEGGNLTTVQSWDSSGRPTEITTVNVTASPSVTESIVYTYSSTSPNVGMMSGATLRRKVGTGSYSTVLSVAYTYHDGTSTTNGLANDLKTVEVKNANNETIDFQYYRYYTGTASPGYLHGMKYALGYESYRRILNDIGNPDTASDSQLAPYADDYFEYTTNNRISKHVFAGYGNSGSAGGLGTYTYSYGTNSSSQQGFNIWKSVMVETNPEGATTTTYTNASGQPLLSIFNDGGSPAKEWAKYNHYDVNGQIDLQAEPSAVESRLAASMYKPSYGDLVNFGSQGNATALKDSSGLLRIYTYANLSTATTTSAGSAVGYLSSVALKRGETAAYTSKIESYDYFYHNANNVDTYVAANIYTYPVEASSTNLTQNPSLATSFVYNGWYTYTQSGIGTVESARPTSVTIRLPAVATGQNGAGGTGLSMTSVYDIYGRTTWFKDAGGFLQFSQYDAATMALVKTISDVNTATTSDFSNLPSGWTTPSGGGLHLKSSLELDAYGRATKTTDPNGNVTYVVYKDATQETRIYSGWVSSTNT